MVIYQGIIAGIVISVVLILGWLAISWQNRALNAETELNKIRQTGWQSKTMPLHYPELPVKQTKKILGVDTW